MSDPYICYKERFYYFNFKDGSGPESFDGLPQEDVEALGKTLDNLLEGLVRIVDSEPEEPVEGWWVEKKTINSTTRTWTLCKEHETILNVEELSSPLATTLTFTFRELSDFSYVTLFIMPEIYKMFNKRKDMKAMLLVKTARMALDDNSPKEVRNDLQRHL